MAVLSQKPGRALWVDVARGLAIAAMIVYHGAFDLAFFRLADLPVTEHWGWRGFAAGIASTFLFIVGVSLVYAHRGGVRWRSFLRRLAIIAGCAAAVSVATILAVPAPVYFGILHAIATFSVLALPFVFLPPFVTVVAALLVLAAPHFLTSPLFSSPLLYPVGLSPVRPVSFDYEPIFPWLSVTLLGVAFARIARFPAAREAPAPAMLRPLIFAGRHSLVIYLVHQPLLFGIFLALIWAGVVSPAVS
ncbi:MAG: heparan-alpha-glucosaminide N-acetyltransferase [Pseudomonadota bacterium]